MPLLKIGISDINYEYIVSQQSFMDSFRYVFINNLKVILLLVSGYFFLGISTIFILIYNGWYLTLSFAQFFYFSNIDFNLFYKFILPHIIFELIAIIVAGSVGIQGLLNIKYLFQEDSSAIFSTLPSAIKKILLSFFLIFIAAIIESFSII